MELSGLARLLAFIGVALLVIAGGLYLISRYDLPFGRMPGDVIIKRENFTCFFPIVSSILLSLLLTLVLNLIARFLQK